MMETHTFVGGKEEDGPLVRIPSVYVPRRSNGFPHGDVHGPLGHVEPADRPSAYLQQQRKPMGPNKYPNYEPFHPPPREDFQYPYQMHPPQQNPYKRKQPYVSSSSSSSLSTGSSRGRSRSSTSRSRSRSYDDRRYDRHYTRSRSRSRSWTRSCSSSTSRSRSSRSSRSRSRSIETYSSCSTSSKSYKIDEKLQEYWEDAEESDDNSEEDLDTELHPLPYHAHNRKKLLLEAVRSLKGNKLRAMLPKVLKDLSTDKLMDECLKTLESMDYTTIIDILEGKIVPKVDSPSPTPSHKKNKKSRRHKAKKKKKKRKSSPVPPSSSSKGITNNLMELLELEYRAKAIRALLNRNGIETVALSETVTSRNNETHTQTIAHTAASPKEPQENTNPKNLENTDPENLENNDDENLIDEAELKQKEDVLIYQDEESSSSSKFLAASSSSTFREDSERQETDEDSLPPQSLQNNIESDGSDDVLELFADNLPY